MCAAVLDCRGGGARALLHAAAAAAAAAGQWTAGPNEEQPSQAATRATAPRSTSSSPPSWPPSSSRQAHRSAAAASPQEDGFRFGFETEYGNFVAQTPFNVHWPPSAGAAGATKDDARRRIQGTCAAGNIEGGMVLRGRSPSPPTSAVFPHGPALPPAAAASSRDDDGRLRGGAAPHPHARFDGDAAAAAAPPSAAADGGAAEAARRQRAKCESERNYRLGRLLFPTPPAGLSSAAAIASPARVREPSQRFSRDASTGSDTSKTCSSSSEAAASDLNAAAASSDLTSAAVSSDLTSADASSDLNSVDASAADNFRFKTELCRNYKERLCCIYGAGCQFAHGRDQLRDVVRNTRYKTKLCQKYWRTGYCAYGPRCNFLHDETLQLAQLGGRRLTEDDDDELYRQAMEILAKCKPTGVLPEPLAGAIASSKIPARPRPA